MKRQSGVEGGIGFYHRTHRRLGAEILHSSVTNKSDCESVPERGRPDLFLNRTSSHLCHFFLRMLFIFPPSIATFSKFSSPCVLLEIHMSDSSRITVLISTHVPCMPSALPSWRVTFQFRNSIKEKSLLG